MRDNRNWTYEELKAAIAADIRKRAQRRILKARRIERERVRQLGGGRHIAAMILGPAKRKRA